MNPLLTYLMTVAPLSTQTVDELMPCVRTQLVKKGHTLLAHGQVCHQIYFVEQGLLRLFYYHQGNEVTDYFATEDSLIGGIDSFFSRQPSQKVIHTLEACRLHSVSFDDLETLYSRHHDLEHVGRLITVGAFLSMQRRLYSRQFHSARQRYEQFVAASPSLLNRVPLGYLASYLGITQVTLSRIRAQRTF